MSAEVYSIHVKVDSTQATTAAKDLGKLETAAGKAENSLKQLSTTSGNTASAAKTLSGAMDSTEASMRKATGAIESVGKAANAVRGAFVVLIGVEVARFMREMASTVREAADAYTQLTSRLAVGTVSQIEAGKAMREVTQIANKYYLSIVDVGNAYSKLNPILADMGRNQADTRSVVESVSAALAIQNGATVDSAETMRQLSQALSGNVLQMEEMNTIIDSAQPLWRGLNKVFAESVAKFGSLKNAISSQAITSEMLTDALIRLKPEFEELAARNTPTLAKAMTVLNNNFITYIGEADKAQGASKELGKMILDLADNLDKVLDPWMEFGKATGEAGIAFGKLATELAPALEIIAKGLAGFFTTVSTSLEGLKLLADGLGAITGNVEKLKGLLGVNEAVVSDRTLERINKELQLNKEKLSQYSEMDRYKLLDAQKIKDLEKEIAILTRMKELVFQNADAKRKAEEEETKRIDAQRQATKRPDVVDEKAAKKAREEAEKNFKAYVDFQIAQAENMARIAKEQNDTKLKQIESEKKALKDAAEVELIGAKNKEERLAIYKKLQEDIEAQIVKETEVRQQMLQGEVDLEQKRIDGAEQLLSKSAEYQMSQADILRIQKEIAEAQTGIETAPESAKQLEIEMTDKLRESAEAYNKELVNTKDAQKDVREEALRTLETLSSNLDYAREMARGLADAFGDVGSSIGEMVVALAEYEKQQATIDIQAEEAIKKNPAKRMEIEQEAMLKHSRNQIKAYGDMTQAAQGFFKKGTKGYEAMGGAVKVFRAFEMAQSALAMVKQVGDMGTILTQFLGMETAKTTAKVASNTAQQASDASGAVTSATKAVADAGQGDPYTGIFRAAAMLAFMAAIGIAIGGGGGGASAQAKPVDTTGMGTVKGDPTAISESISKSLDLLVENSSNDLNYSADMLEALRNIESALRGVGDLIATDLTPVMTNLASQFGGENIKQAGFVIDPQRFSRVYESGLLKGNVGARIETESSMLGVTIKKGQTFLEPYGKKYQEAFGSVVRAIADGVIEVGKIVGLTDKEVLARLKDFRINLGKIDIAGLSAEEAAKKIEAAFSAMSDEMAKKALPEFIKFQKTGEGYFETINRVGEGINRATGVLDLLGMEAIKYTDIIDKQGDVAAEITRQTIMAQGDLTEGTREYVRQLEGSAEDIVESYKKIIDITNLMRAGGFGTEGLDRTLINAAGGLDEFASSLQSFYDNFLSDEQRVASQTALLTAEFGKLGYSLPKSKDEFTRLAQSIDRSTEDGKKLFAALIRLSQGFSDLIDSSEDLADANREAAEAAAEAAWKQQEALLKAEEKRLQDIQKAQEDVAAQAKKAYDEAFNALSKAFSDLEKVQDRYVAVGKTLLQFYRELTGAKMPMASPEERYRLARQELERVRSLAATGDEAALAQLVDAGKDFLDASKEYNASSAAYQQDYQMVLSVLEDGQAYAQAQVNIAQQQLDYAKAQFTQLQKVDSSVLTTTQAVANLTSAVGNFAQATITNTAAAAAAANAAAQTAAAAAATAAAAAAAAKTPVTQATGGTTTYQTLPYQLPSTAPAVPVVKYPWGSYNAPTGRVRQDGNWEGVVTLVRNLYRQLLGREPENEAVVGALTKEIYEGRLSPAEAVQQFRNSAEYRDLVSRGFVPGFARGGMAGPGFAVVGEEGPELVRFGTNAHVSTAGQTSNLFAGIRESIEKGDAEQVNELQALVRLQSAANQQLIKEMRELKGEMAELSRKAKLEAAA